MTSSILSEKTSDSSGSEQKTENYLDRECSMVANAKETATSTTTIRKILSAIGDGRWRVPVEAVRAAFALGGKDAAKPLKEKLPAMMPSGRFSVRRKDALQTYTSAVCADLDDLNSEKIESVCDKLKNDPHIIAFFKSPSSGLKPLVAVSCGGDRHSDAWIAVANYLFDNYGLTVDPQTKDVSRLCYVSYDPNLFMNENAVALEIPSGMVGTYTAPADTDGLLLLPGNGITITGSAEKIFERIALTKTIFIRGGIVHELEREPDDTLGLAPISASAFRSRIEAYGMPMAWRADSKGRMSLRQTPCPEETAKALLSATAAKTMLPPIANVLACPILTRKGDELLVLGHGYHAVNDGVFITGGENPPEVPVPEAVAAIVSLISDFDFLTPGDHSRAIAAILTPAFRFGNIMKGFHPIDVAEADTSQSGKTFRQFLTALIYRERPQVVIQRSGGVGSTDESISQKLITGRPFIQLDNFRGKLDSTLLESMSTPYGNFSARVPHRGEIPVDPKKFFFMLSSNGCETTKDLANRSSIIRIRKHAEGYRWKAWPEGRVDEHVRTHQAHYLGCVFSIITAWAETGMPTTAEGRHDFREWAQSLDWIVQNLFGAAPLMDGHEEAKARVANPALTWLRKVALALSEDGRLAAPLSASALVELCQEKDLLVPGVRPDSDEDMAKRLVGMVMARLFKTQDHLMVDGFTIRRCEQEGHREGHGSVRPLKVYLFSKGAGND